MVTPQMFQFCGGKMIWALVTFITLRHTNYNYILAVSCLLWWSQV